VTTSHESAIDAVRKRVPNARARVGVILGSGWSSLTDHVKNAQKIPYGELPGFPRASIAGHSGALVLGKIGEQDVAVLGGRKHVYEEGDVKAMQVPILTLRALGCETLVQTNAAGSLDTRMPPGSLMAITDHINLPQRSPLVGENGSDRFVSMVDAYDPALRRAAQKVAQRAAVDLHEGVYVWCLGPQFETPAEIRLCVQVGGRAVGMSTVPRPSSRAAPG
jgi:purine-nucleoside phosphorylase